MSKYDYFVGGRWRNHEVIRQVLQALRAADKRVYCFVDNSYFGDGIDLDATYGSDVEKFMRELEATDNWRTNPTFRQIYENDMNGLKDSEEVIIVLPAGASAHMELGAGFGLGKKCYGIGQPEKHETLYLMFEEIYPDIENFVKAKVGQFA